MRDEIENLIASVAPYDKMEQEHITNTLLWIRSKAEIFRLKKPDTPPKHLVSYFVLVDKKKRKLLLINHIKTGLWLPPGGHVENNEHPADTVKREIQEELGIKALFIFDDPFFITVTKTVNIDAGHTDVSLWYLLKGDMLKKLEYDKSEMNGYRWFSFEEILQLAMNKCDPHMHRFTNKLLNSV
ncbi:MAG: NUDIX hydrolase [Candidatus Levyibacteriota bacterium]